MRPRLGPHRAAPETSSPHQLRHVTTAASIAAFLFGMGALIGSFEAGESAIAGLAEESSWFMARSIELDRIIEDAAAGDTGRARARVQLERAIESAADVAEFAAFRGALECISGRACDGGLEDALAPARTLCASRIERARAHARRAEVVRTGLAAVGSAACIPGLLLLLRRMFRGRGLGATDEEERPQPAGPEGSSSREIEELFRQRLGQLYATHARASESDHFAAYGEIAAALSHGLKTPLASIRAATQVAQLKIDPNHAARPFLDQIIDEVDGLVEQVRRFLSAAGPCAPAEARVQPERFLAVLEQAYAGEARTKGVSWSTKASGELGEIVVDPALLEMALRNLVENALAVSPSGSSVSVVARPCSAPDRAGLESTPPSHHAWVELVVLDQGPGIPPEVLSGQPVASTKPNGSGLGVAIARRIVLRHGGALLFDSAPIQGTAVHVVLPVAASPERGSGIDVGEGARP